VPDVKIYLAAVGVAMLILAAVLFVRRLSALLRGASVLGRIQGHEVRTFDEEVSYLPIVGCHTYDTPCHAYVWAVSCLSEVLVWRIRRD
jgi:hypothetical protein